MTTDLTLTFEARIRPDGKPEVSSRGEATRCNAHELALMLAAVIRAAIEVSQQTEDATGVPMQQALNQALDLIQSADAHDARSFIHAKTAPQENPNDDRPHIT